MGGDGVEVNYEEVGSSMGGMARLRRKRDIPFP